MHRFLPDVWELVRSVSYVLSEGVEDSHMDCPQPVLAGMAGALSPKGGGESHWSGRGSFWRVR